MNKTAMKGKKLMLNKRSIRELTATDMVEVNGGNGSVFLTQSTCRGQSAKCSDVTSNTSMG